MEQQHEIAWAARLITEFEAICYTHNVDMALPVIRISDSKTRFGLWESDLRTISISRYLIETYPWHIVLEVLKHEMAHQYVSELLNEKDAHGPIFKKACKILGVHPNFIQSCGAIDPELLDPKNMLSPKAQKMIRTVQKLLSLAKSDNENEARSASKKANELIQRHNLTLFEEDTCFAENQATYRVITHKKKQIQRLQKSILQLLSQFYYVHPVLTRYYDAKDNDSYQSMVLFGLPENLEIAEYVYHYLFETGKRLWKQNKSLYGYTRGDQISFHIGFIQGLQKTLEGSTFLMKPNGQTDKALVSAIQSLSVSMNKKINSELNRVFPKTIKRKSRYRHSDDAFNKGYKEGKNTHIRKGIHKKDDDSKLLIEY